MARAPAAGGRHLSAALPGWPGPTVLNLRASAQTGLFRALEAREPVILLVGDDGVGKTTLLNAVLGGSDPALHVLRLGNWVTPTFSLDELLAQLGAQKQDDGDATLEGLIRVLRTGRDQGNRLVLAVEEAETLEDPALHLLGLLPSLTAAGLPRIQVVLVGGPALRERLAEDRFRRLRDLVATEIVLTPLTEPESRAYLRWQCRARGITGAGLAALPLGGIAVRAGGIPERLDELLEETLGASGLQGEDIPPAPAHVPEGKAAAPVPSTALPSALDPSAPERGAAPLRLVVSHSASGAQGVPGQPDGVPAAVQDRRRASWARTSARARVLATTAGLGVGLCAALAAVILADKGVLQLAAPTPAPTVAAPSPDGPVAAGGAQPAPAAGPQTPTQPEAAGTQPAPAPAGDGRAADARAAPANVLPVPFPVPDGPAPGNEERSAGRPRGEVEAARLRREFDLFLRRQGGAVSRLSDAQRRDLFREYLAWRERQEQR